MTQDELATAVGTDRRNIGRWETDGHDPGGTVLLRLLSALGVGLVPSPPPALPGAVNAELQALRMQLDADRDEAARRHDELIDRLETQAEQLRVLSARAAAPLSE